MDINKQVFQNKLTILEDGLSQYIHQYPQSVAQIFRNHIYVCMTAIIVAIVINIVPHTEELTTPIIIAAIITCWFLLVIAKPDFGLTDESDSVLKSVKKTKDDIQDFEQYSDVKKYLIQYNQKLEQTIDKKNKIYQRFRTIILILVLITNGSTTAHLIYHYNVYKPKRDLEQIKKYMLSEIATDLNIDITGKQPMLTLKVMQQNVSDTIQLEKDSIDLNFYIKNNYGYLRFTELKINWYTYYRVYITNQQGIPIKNSPFVDISAYDQQPISMKLCPDISDKKACAYETGRFLKYLLTHQDSIRVLIEQIDYSY